jgi:hypothetical protein
MPVCRPVIMEHALGSVQNFVFLDAERLELLDHVIEVAVRRLVGAYVFSRIDGVEFELLAEKLMLSTFDRMTNL